MKVEQKEEQSECNLAAQRAVMTERKLDNERVDWMVAQLVGDLVARMVGWREAQLD